MSRRPPLALPGVVHVVANTFGLVVLAVVVVSFAFRGIVALPRQPAARGSAPATAPNLYFVLLDGYPRQDTLEALGIDNRPFIQDLEERGFAMAPRSHTNYHNTLLTLPRCSTASIWPRSRSSSALLVARRRLCDN